MARSATARLEDLRHSEQRDDEVCDDEAGGSPVLRTAWWRRLRRRGWRISGTPNSMMTTSATTRLEDLRHSEQHDDEVCDGQVSDEEIGGRVAHFLVGEDDDDDEQITDEAG